MSSRTKKRPRAETAPTGYIGTGRVYVVLAGAYLQTARVRKAGRHESTEPVLLSSDEHANYISRTLGRDPALYRPDITHQCLLTLLDSPLNKADRLRVYIHTAQNVLVEVHPRVRMPRTFARFSGLMAQLLEKRRIMATNSNEVLLRVIQNPITKYLPVGSRKILLTDTSDHLNDIRQVAVDEVGDNEDIVFAIGAISHGEVAPEWTEESMAISVYSCSAAMICSRVCHAFEGRYGIL
ncbi:hypothetical protein CCYA_CCYA12G3333 [Cyanidiococcus yangmingshanensis]|nr:hypothetical protein CCYA_CCYA12G3333 [Cyanidiococcus yangmingshanensis]